MRAELDGQAFLERAALLAELEEVRRQMADAEASFERRKTELARAMARLDEVAAGLPEVRLAAARAALAAGDTGRADAIFAEIAGAGSRSRGTGRNRSVRARQAGRDRHSLDRRGGTFRDGGAACPDLRASGKGPRTGIADGGLSGGAALW
jgi:hypothetical protein